MRALAVPGAMVALLVLTVSAGAQQPAPQPADSGGRRASAVAGDTGHAVVRLSPLQVTVTRQAQLVDRTAQSVSVVNADRIRTAQATLGLDESLSLVPGVVADDRYNVSLGTRISIRGFGSRAAFGVRGVKVLVDGIPLTNADGQAKLTNLDLGSAGEIEVIRGPASTLYGNAAGGVISIRTQDPPAQPLAGEARVTFGDEGSGTSLDNLAKYQLLAGGRSGNASYLASFARTNAAGFRDFSNARLTNFNGIASYRLDGASSLRLLLNVADQPLAENPGSLPLAMADTAPRAAWPLNIRMGAAEDAFQAQTGIGYRREIGPGQLDVVAYGSNRRVNNPLTYAIINLNRHTGGIRSTYSAAGSLFGLSAGLIGGIDYELLRDAREQFQNAGAAVRGAMNVNELDQVSAVGPFLEASIDPLPKLRLTSGVRYDAVAFHTHDHLLSDGDNSGARTLRAVSPKASLLFMGSRALNAYATVATSFQTPTTTELINTPPAPGQPCCTAGFNQALNPERALSWEAGLKGTLADWLRYDLAAYTMNVRDEIVAFTVPQVTDRSFYRNAGRSRHRGVELGLEAAPTSFLRLAAAYTYAHFVFLDDGATGANDGHRLPGIPPQQLTGVVTFLLPGVSAEAEAQHVARFYVNDDNTASNPAYTVVDFRLQGRQALGPLGVAPFVGLENAFDRRYNASVVINATGGRYYEPAPGRHLLLGLSVPIAGWRP